MQKRNDAPLQTYGPHALGSAACSRSGAQRSRTSEYPVVSTQSTLCEYSEYQLWRTAVPDLLDVSELRVHRRDRLERRDPLIRRLADPYPDLNPTYSRSTLRPIPT